MQVAFHNFNDFNGQMYNQIAMAAIQEGLNIGDIANDVNMGWDTDPVTTSNYYNHVGAGKYLSKKLRFSWCKKANSDTQRSCNRRQYCRKCSRSRASVVSRG